MSLETSFDSSGAGTSSLSSKTPDLRFGDAMLDLLGDVFRHDVLAACRSGCPATAIRNGECNGDDGDDGGMVVSTCIWAGIRLLVRPSPTIGSRCWSESAGGIGTGVPTRSSSSACDSCPAVKNLPPGPLGLRIACVITDSCKANLLDVTGSLALNSGDSSS